jgi:hypothetical protein
MRVSRYALPILLFAVSAGAPAIWSAAASAQHSETSKPEAPNAAGSPADSKSAPGHVPKDILIVNPCKAAHPPSYCNVRN